MRILDINACLENTHLSGPGVKFNLQLTDPLTEVLDTDAPWRGVAGDYVIDLGGDSRASAGQDSKLPTLKASVNAFSRLWFGVRPASHLAITDELQGEATLIRALDHALALPSPHFGWDF